MRRMPGPLATRHNSARRDRRRRSVFLFGQALQGISERNFHRDCERHHDAGHGQSACAGGRDPVDLAVSVGSRNSAQRHSTGGRVSIRHAVLSLDGLRSHRPRRYFLLRADRAGRLQHVRHRGGNRTSRDHAGGRVFESGTESGDDPRHRSRSADARRLSVSLHLSADPTHHRRGDLQADDRHVSKTVAATREARHRASL